MNEKEITKVIKFLDNNKENLRGLKNFLEDSPQINKKLNDSIINILECIKILQDKRDNIN